MATTEINRKTADDLAIIGHDPGELMSAAALTTRIRTRLNTALQSTRTGARRAQSSAVATVKATDQCVREHPYPTIGVFFGLGLLMGVLLARK